MEFTLYILVIVLVLIKIIIWSCVCYTRSRRLRAAQQRIIIVRDPQAAMTRQVDQHGIIHNEHIPSVPDIYGGITNPQLATFAPPSYDEIIRTPQEATKPPSYEQVIKEQRIGASQEHGSK